MSERSEKIVGLFNEAKENKQFTRWLEWVKKYYLDKNKLDFRIDINKDTEEISLLISEVLDKDNEQIILKALFLEETIRILSLEKEEVQSSYKQMLGIIFIEGFAFGIYGNNEYNLHAYVENEANKAKNIISRQN